MADVTTVFSKLCAVQRALKVPKNQYNSFGKYKYRSCEDIVEAVKPLCAEHGLLLTMTDRIELIGERYYVTATATVISVDDGASTSVTASAREEDAKKGMDGSQITGTASSYARKYALNGLFAIDDTKDADTEESMQTGRRKQNNGKQSGESTRTTTAAVCADCGKNITDTVMSDGGTWRAADISGYSNQAFGRPLCVKCQGKLNAQQAGRK